jgi:hypothetical protein
LEVELVAGTVGGIGGTQKVEERVAAVTTHVTVEGFEVE